MAEDARQIRVYDSTLRDGCQTVGVNLSVDDKLQIARTLDNLGVHYIEGGYPASNPKDKEFFSRVGSLKLSNAKVVAFGSTRRTGIGVSQDEGLNVLLASETPGVTIVAKSWRLHVEKVLRATMEENLRMVGESVRYLKDRGREVIVDAEHFFDGYRAEPDYALNVVRVAGEAGADCVVLCDTNGGSLCSFVREATGAACEKCGVPIGIHCHNDSGLAIAASIAALESGAVHVQGTLNGWGERCGNADLCALLPVIELKMGMRAIGEQMLRKLTEASRVAYEAANMPPRTNQAFVGADAFAHKGGLHVDAMRKDRRTYEHIKPDLVGNEGRFLVSELSGQAAVKYLTERFEIPQDREVTGRILKRVMELENEGYQFETAEGSFALLALREAGMYRPLFDVEGYHVSVISMAGCRLVTDAAVKLRVGGERMHTACEGDGPVNALDGALRKALEPHYAALRSVRLTDYRVRVINAGAATAAKVCVVIQSADERHTWGSVGVSENIIEASWHALIDSIEYKLLSDERRNY